MATYTTLNFLNTNFAHLTTSERLRLVCEYLDMHEGTQRDFAEWMEDTANNGLVRGMPEALTGGRVCGNCGFKFLTGTPFANTVCPSCGSDHIHIGY